MDPRAYRIAQEFLRAHLRDAKYQPEFLEWTAGRQFRNPESGNEVQFQSLPSGEQKRIYQQWAKAKGVQEESSQTKKPQSKEEITQRNLDIARNGEVVSSEVLSTGGRGEGEDKVGINQSSIVKLRHNGQEQVFIHKPADGEEPHLRVGIPGGTYHAREQATYQLDQMLGGHGVVPATVTRGDGSYQLWADGARAMHGKDLNELVGKVKADELHRSPDFERINVLDLISGHEDRHRGNMLYYFEDDKEDPEHLRFVAIDNGMTMAEPSDLPDHRAYYHPFGAMYAEPTIEDIGNLPTEKIQDPNHLRRQQQQLADEAEETGNKEVARSLASISPEMHEQLKQIDLGEAAKSLSSSGVKEQGAIRAALVRIAALQEDPKLFKQFLRRSSGKLDEAWREFQHSSGWTQPERLDNLFADAQKELEGFDSWGIFEEEPSRDSDEKTKRDSPADLKTKKDIIGNVRDRWLTATVSSALHRTTTRTGRLFPKRP
jgi:hypothetical protein